MKKIVVIALLLVYGLSSTGATVHLHFCCGKLDDISFSSTNSKICSTKTFSSTKKCCDSKHIELKVKADQEPGAKWIAACKVFTTQCPASYYGFTPTHKIPVNALATGPPLRVSAVPLFIQHCIYLI
jgi:hypothetical protein